MAFAKGKEPLKFRLIKARKKHLAAIDQLLVEVKIVDHSYSGSLQHAWVVIVDKSVVGFGSLQFIGKRVAVLTNLAVKKELRHRGIGSALINKRLEVARAAQVQVVALCTMYYHFRKYKKRGFRTVPRAELPEDIRSFHQFTDKRYMKASVMVKINQN